MAKSPAARKAEAEQRKAEAEARRAEADAKARAAEADAKGRAAEAEARAAEAKARIDEQRSKAQAEQRRIDAAAAEAQARRTEQAKQRADAERRAAEALPWQVGATAAAVPGGIAAGVALSKVIESRHQATIRVANTQLNALGTDVARTIAKVPDKGSINRTVKAKLTGAVAAADKLGLARMKGPLGLTAAGLILAEAAFTRFGLAPQLQDERARAVAGGVATASVFAATNLIGERLIQNATPKALPKATALAAIETARTLITPRTAAPAAAGSVAGFAAKAAPIAGKVLARALPIATVAMAVYEAAKGYQKEGVKGAAIGVADSLTFGLVSAGRAYLNDGAAEKANAAPKGGGSDEPKSAPQPDTGSGDIWVPGYSKSDGTKVEGYYRAR